MANRIFVHSTPALYDRYMGPLLFELYAKLVAERCAALQPKRILETAAGTAIVTREAAQGLVFGSPFRSEFERREPSALDRAAEAVAQALERWDGKDAPTSAHLVTARTFVAT